MSNLKVISWNVLNEYYLHQHRDSNQIIASYYENKDRKERDNSVIYQIEQFMISNQPQVICLQEVNENIIPHLEYLAARYNYNMRKCGHKKYAEWPAAITGYPTDAYGQTLTQNYNVTFVFIPFLGNYPLGYETIFVDLESAQIFYFESIRTMLVNVHLPSSSFKHEFFKALLEKIVAKTLFVHHLIIAGDFNTKAFVVNNAWKKENLNQQNFFISANDEVSSSNKTTRIGTINHVQFVEEKLDHVLLRGIKLLYSVSSFFDITKYVQLLESPYLYASDHLAIEWNFFVPLNE